MLEIKEEKRSVEQPRSSERLNQSGEQCREQTRGKSVTTRGENNGEKSKTRTPEDDKMDEEKKMK